jgi:hypothetical protein
VIPIAVTKNTIVNEQLLAIKIVRALIHTQNPMLVKLGQYMRESCRGSGSS